jgi:hypothetical protein
MDGQIEPSRGRERIWELAGNAWAKIGVEILRLFSSDSLRMTPCWCGDSG